MPDFSGQPAKTADAAVDKAGLKLAVPLYRQVEIPPVAAIAAHSQTVNRAGPPA